MRIESGIAKKLKSRQLITAAGLLALAAWCAYDGWIKYPRQNLEELQKRLSTTQDVKHLPVQPLVKEGIVEQTTALKTRDEFEKLLGRPAAELNLGANRVEVAWLGPDGAFKAQFENGRVVEGRAAFTKTVHSSVDVLSQQGLAAALALGALWVLFRLSQMSRRRFIVDDSGLTISGRPVIPWDAMRGLASEQFAEKGWVDLRYDSGGQPQMVRLDSYEIDAFDQIVEQICIRKGFANPMMAGGNDAPRD